MRVAVAAALLTACAAPASSPRATDLAIAATPADLATSDLAPAVCGNDDCEPDENGANYGSDCCDAATSYDTTHDNDGAYFCHSMNDGPFAWYTQGDATALCSDASQIGHTTWACAARSGFCCSVPGGFVDGPCP